MSKTTQWTTDNKVTWYTSEEDINVKLASELGERFVQYRKMFDSVNRFEIETKFPLYLQVELHQICNLRCPMCSITVPEAREKYITDDHLSWEMYEKIILEAEKYECPSLNPQGTNEPLLDQNLDKSALVSLTEFLSSSDKVNVNFSPLSFILKSTFSNLEVVS